VFNKKNDTVSFDTRDMSMASVSENNNASAYLDETQEISSEKLSQRDARSLVFHLLYAMEAFNYEVSLESVVDNFARGFNIHITRDGAVFKKAASIIDHRESLDEQIRPLLSNWRLERLGFSTRLIIRLAMWELVNSDIAPSIVINEAVELAKCFAEHDAYKFVNGVLDEWIKRNKPELLKSSDEEPS
jgi:transcription antitermination protein NusB